MKVALGLYGGASSGCPKPGKLWHGQSGERGSVGALSERCRRCGLAHTDGELFVMTDIEGDRPVVIDTCELEAAWRSAHAAAQPAGTLAYHATRHPEEALVRGLDPQRSNARCKHVCLAETPYIAAGVEIADVVLEVDVSGLDLFFELGEARHHDTLIEPERLRVLDWQPAPMKLGWSDPAWRRNHSDCIALLDLPLSRRRLNAADKEMRRRWPYDGYDDARFRSVLAEHAAK